MQPPLRHTNLLLSNQEHNVTVLDSVVARKDVSCNRNYSMPAATAILKSDYQA